MAKRLLEVEDLSVSFTTEQGTARVLDGVSFTVSEGETLGLVGESGCGKSVTSLAISRLLPQPSGRIDSGRVMFDGRDLVQAPKAELHKLRGRDIAMIFQDAMTALNPVKRIGAQLLESMTLLRPELDPKAQIVESIALLDRVGIPEPEARLRDYPHQLSGGMRQRVMIAMALVGNPKLLIADEPTTALDVTVQAQILALIQRLKTENNMAVIFITHDLGVVAQICQRVTVMYAGRMVESGTVQAVFENPKHPYTEGLLGSLPSLERAPLSELPTIEGTVPGPFAMPPGCRFAPRCNKAQPHCETHPTLQISGGRQLACHEVSL